MNVARPALELLCSARPDNPCPHRIFIVAAHPDDEIVGAGARLLSLTGAIVVHTTDGAPRDLRDARAARCATAAEYAAMRAGERALALALAGIPADRIVDIGLADQESTDHLADLTRSLERLFAATSADVVVTHPYEGGHPDHDAAAFAVHHAVARRGHAGRPMSILEFTSYHFDGAALRTGRFPPDGGPDGRRLDLSRHERAMKQRMLACHASQSATLAAFRTDAECFRPAPAYDFTRPPKAAPGGRVFYDWQPWRVTGEQFRAAAARAAQTLGAEGAA